MPLQSLEELDAKRSWIDALKILNARPVVLHSGEEMKALTNRRNALIVQLEEIDHGIRIDREVIAELTVSINRAMVERTDKKGELAATTEAMTALERQIIANNTI